MAPGARVTASAGVDVNPASLALCDDVVFAEVLTTSPFVARECAERRRARRRWNKPSKPVQIGMCGDRPDLATGGRVSAGVGPKIRLIGTDAPMARAPAGTGRASANS